MEGSAAVQHPEIVRGHMALLASLSLLCVGLHFMFQAAFCGIFCWCAIVSGAVNLAAWLSFPRCKDKPLFFISLTWFNVAVLAVVVGDTGGISSPFIFLFFWLMISEAIYGIEDRWLPFFTAACYLFSVYGDSFGALRHVHSIPPGQYDSRFIALVSGLNCFFILLAGFSSRHIIGAVLAKLELARLKQAELGRKCAEMSPYSHIGTAVHGIAHDLRTPLASALGYLSFKAAKTSDPDDAEIIKMISESLEQMSGTLTQITCYGRRSDMKREIVQLKSLLTGVRAMLVFHPAAAGVELSAHFPDGEMHVEMPRHDLQLAFFNVIKNSLEAAGTQAEKKVVISLRRAGVYAEVEVSDTGPGVPAEILPRLLKGGATSKSGGTGVGLEITKDFICENGGTFEIVNGPQRGALARIRLPLQSAA